jgi:ABC-type branched-subunit amino acid transport system substrate-binding protein
VPRPRPGFHGAYRLAGGTALALALLIPTACGGSRITPQVAAAANRAALGLSGGGAAANGPATAPDAGTDAPAPGVEGSGSTPSPGLPTEDAGGSPAGSGSSSGGQSGSSGSEGASKGGVAEEAAGGGIKPGSCAGFRNQTGITDKTIAIGNSSDVTGPIPGLFAGAQLATQAYVAYFNATNPNGICGRKLVLTDLDSRTDAGADLNSYTTMCGTSFAAVGSMSAFDSGGAAEAQSCGLPDIRSAAVTAARNACTTCYAAQNTGTGEYTNAVYDFWIRRDKPATQKAAFAYLDSGAAAENAKTQIAVGKKRGMNWVYTTPIDVADFNYGPYVQQMKSKGVQFVQFLGAYQQSVRMAQAMQAADFHPKVLMYDPSVYDDNFLKTGGSAIEGAYMFITFLPLDSDQPELNLYREWLSQVSPGTTPTFFGLFSWSASKLFVEKALQLGGRLNRANLVASLRTVEDWTGGGIHVPSAVGSKHAPSCVRYMRVSGGKFVPYGSTQYLCTGYSKG